MDLDYCKEKIYEGIVIEGNKDPFNRQLFYTVQLNVSPNIESKDLVNLMSIYKSIKTEFPSRIGAITNYHQITEGTFYPKKCYAVSFGPEDRFSFGNEKSLEIDNFITDILYRKYGMDPTYTHSAMINFNFTL